MICIFSLGMYNIFFTSWPPIAMGLFDQQCRAETRMKYPSMYRATQKSEYFNHRVFWIWMANSLLHSVILYWLPMAVYKSSSIWGGGETGGYLVVGNMVYTFVVITVCCKAGLEIDSWNYLSHLSIWGSIALWFIFLAVYSYFWPLGLPLAANMAGMVELIAESPVFWFGLLLIPFTALLPDLVYKVIRTTVWMTETEKIRIAEILHTDPAPYMEGTEARNGLSETSGLLDNIRKIFKRRRSGSEDIAMGAPALGYAFSQEEGGAISQEEFIRRYDTTAQGRGTAGAAARTPATYALTPPDLENLATNATFLSSSRQIASDTRGGM